MKVDIISKDVNFIRLDSLDVNVSFRTATITFLNDSEIFIWGGDN